MGHTNGSPNDGQKTRPYRNQQKQKQKKKKKLTKNKKQKRELENYGLCCLGRPQNKTEKSEEKDKYLNLARELKNLWNMKVTIIPIVNGTFSTVTKWLLKGCPRGVMVKAMHCGIVVREFVLQSRYYVHFRANTLGKGMNPLILTPAMGK